MTDQFYIENSEVLAVVDIGSNSVRMNIYEINLDNEAIHVISSSRAMLKLASYKNDGVLSKDGEGKLYGLLREYLAKANSYPADKFIAFATQSLRGIKNSDSILHRIKNGLGIEIEILSGVDEARYDFIAAKKQFGSKMANKGIVVDMGGGSTELIAFEGDDIKHIVSVPIGAVALWKSYVSGEGQRIFPDAKAKTQIESYVKKTLSSILEYKDFGGTAYLIGGTARTFSRFDADIMNSEKGPDGYIIPKERFDLICDTVTQDAKKGAKLIKKICPDRLTSIVPGILSYSLLLTFLNVDKAVISLSGVREGYVTEYIQKRKENPVKD